MRYLVLLLLGYALLVIEGALLALLPLRAAAPDVALLVVVAVALSRRGTAPTQAAFACALGYVADVLSGGPRGMLAFTFVVMSIVGRFFSRRVYAERIWGRALAALVCTALAGTTTVLVRGLVVEGTSLRSLGLVPVHAALTAVFAPIVIGLCRRIDTSLGIAGNEGLQW
jgi:rod shape-determining protein MreD